MHSLVTGGGGFLGRYIVEALLARGDHVRSIHRRDYPTLEAMGVEVVRGDIRDAATVLEACRDIDCVFHTAARPGIDMNWRLYDQVNRLGTLSVLSGCQRANVHRLVYTSSPSVTFEGKDQDGIGELPMPTDATANWLKNNRAYYSLTKLHAEQAVLAANCDSLRTCALRPHLIWGPRDSHLIPRLIERARSRRLRRVGDGTNLVDVTYVENAAEAHLQAADALANDVRRGSPGAADSNDRQVSGITEAGRPAVNRSAGSGDPRTTTGTPPTATSISAVAETASPAGKAYFISQGEPVNCWQWINEILALVDLPPVSKSMSYKTANRIGTACETSYRFLGLSAEPPMTRFLASQLSMSHWFDISAARRDFGYAPRVTTGEGMRRLGDWLLAGT